MFGGLDLDGVDFAVLGRRGLHRGWCVVQGLNVPGQCLSRIRYVYHQPRSPYGVQGVMEPCYKLHTMDKEASLQCDE